MTGDMSSPCDAMNSGSASCAASLSCFEFDMQNQKNSVFTHKKFGFIVGILLLGTVLSGCVGSTVNNTLDVAALGSADASDIPSSENLPVSEAAASSEEAVYETVEATKIPVPQRSPIASTAQVALVPGDETEPAEAAANAIIVEPAASTPELASADLAVAALETGEPASQTAQTAAVAPVPVITPKPVKKHAGVFGGLFGNKPTANKQLASISQTPKAPSKTPSYSANGDLPGVKRNRAIFGVSDEEGKDEDEANVQVASVGGFGRATSPTGLILQTERVQVDCFKPELLKVLKIVERHYKKKVMVTSGYRSPTGNRRAGGASNSTHIYCKAADIQVAGVSKWDMAKFLRTIPGRGGVGTYCRTESVHIDIGTQRDWHHPCSRGSKKRKA